MSIANENSRERASAANAHFQQHWVWQDREIRFDAPPQQLAARKGEQVIDSINSVEDTKGNNGDRGSLVVTNLRILWISHKNTKTNLSIGFNTTLNISIKKAKSRLRGNTQALYIMTKFGPSRFEFVFTSLVKHSPRLFTTVQSVLRAYETTKLYRDLKLRGSIVRDSQLDLLPMEQVYNQIQGVWNLSSDQGNLGTYFITNVRLVWHANLAQNFNVSIPYMQMKDIRIRQSKFGPALVVETSPKSGGYILGFRIDPQERLDEVYKEVQSLHQVFSVSPIFGVNYVEEDKGLTPEQAKLPRVEDDVEIIEGGEHEDSHHDAVAAYFADAHKQSDREIVFDTDLGLAIEAPQGGATTESLWQIKF